LRTAPQLVDDFDSLLIAYKEIVDVVIVLDGSIAVSVAMTMRIRVMGLVIAHCEYSVSEISILNRDSDSHVSSVLRDDTSFSRLMRRSAKNSAR
jgi:hypothetical protein